MVWYHSVAALFLRELHTRFGKHRLGALWLLAEPVLSSLIVLLVVGQRHPLSGGVDSVGFTLAGAVSWGLTRNLFNSVQKSVDANQGLFAYRQVVPLSTMIARALLESVLSLTVYLTLLGLCCWWGEPAGLPHPLELLGCWILLTALGGGLGLLLAALQAVAPSAARACNLGMRPLMWFSGVYYSVLAMPPDWQALVMWNPVLHAIELVRVQQFGSAYVTPCSWQLPTACALGLITAGLIAYQATWRRMVAS